MKKLTITICLFSLFATSCNTFKSAVFGKKTAHEDYQDKLDDKGLDHSPEGRAWLAASQKALEEAQPVNLPYKQLGVFPASPSRALGLTFTAKRGQRLTFTVQGREHPVSLFADVFNENNITTAIISSEPGKSAFYMDVPETGNYILRLQPKLSQGGFYTLSIQTGASLEFPVTGGKAKPGSFWGADRDGGKRSHEGIDIFAPKRTPVIAAEAGVVVAVRDGGLGGKTVSVRIPERDITLYYAHLDKQMVREGQLVNKGDVLGLVGNTGNAKHTASHLHFGIYTFSGAIDPFPFINKEIEQAPDVVNKDLDKPLKLVKIQKPITADVKINSILIPLAVNGTGYITESPGGKVITAPFNSVKPISQKEAETVVQKTTLNAGKS